MPAYRPERLEEVFTALATMAPHEQIVRSLGERWSVRPRTVRNYLREAQRMLAAQAQDPKALEQRREEFSTSAQLIFRKQLAAGHYRAAMQTLSEMARWYGIGQPQASTVSIYNANGALTSKEAIDAQLAQFHAELEQRARELADERNARLLTDGGAEPAPVVDEGGNDGSVH